MAAQFLPLMRSEATLRGLQFLLVTFLYLSVLDYFVIREYYFYHNFSYS